MAIEESAPDRGYRALFECSPQPMWVYDRETLAFLAVNEAAVRHYGYGREEFLAMTIEDIRPPEDVPRLAAALRVVKPGIDEAGVWRHRTKDGTLIDVEIRSHALVFERRAAELVLALDVSRRRRSDAALGASEERLRLAMAAAGQAFYDLDVLTGKIVVGPEYARMLGYDPADFVETDEGWRERLHPDDREAVLAVFHDCLAGLAPDYRIEFRERAMDGTWRWILSLGRVLSHDGAGRALRMLGTRTDITDRKRAEERGRLAADRLEAVIKAANVGLWEWDLRTNRVHYSREWKRQIGYEEHEVSDNFAEWQDRVHPDDLGPTLKVVEAFLARPWPNYNVEFRFRHRDGTYRWILAQASLQHDEQGRAIRMLGCHVDITEHKAVETERARLVSAIEQVMDAVVVSDTDGRIAYVNPAFESMTGYSRAEAIGQNPRFLKSGEHAQAFYGSLWDALRQGKTWRGRFVNRRKDGSRFVDDSVISPVRDSAGIVSYVAVKRDVTEDLRRAEERESLLAQLAQAQKLESVGRLAGGVAHDFNNALSVIIGRAELALKRNGVEDRLRLDLEEMLKAAQRSAGLTRQLLAFARKQVVAPRLIDLNEAVAGMSRMLRRLIGEDIELTLRPGASLWPVRLDPSQLDQVLANLAINARDAIEGAGRIEIATRNQRVGARDGSAGHGLPPGDYVALAFADDGAGMDEATRARVFEPFFSTKGDAGTGLGLATVHGIVQQNGGAVEIDSSPGLGATFTILLPRAAGQAAPADGEGPVRPLRGGSETILLVEDERALLALAAELLVGLGYVVLAASEPAEALRLAETHPGRIDLLLSDVVMPGMDGRRLAAECQRLRPGLRCLFTSGYTADVIARHGFLEEGFRLLQKPYSAQQVSEGVREALEN